MEIKREIKIKVKPSVGEIAKCIWDMDAEEQAFLLHEIRRLAFDNPGFGYMQLSYIKDEVVKRGEQIEIGKFIEDLREYLGRESY